MCLEHFLRCMHATSLIWQYLLDCWQLCNPALHNPQDIPPEAHILAQQAQEILETARNNLDLANIIPAQPIKTILQHLICRLHKWVCRGKSQLNNCLTAVHKQAILHPPNIRTFFHPTQANDLPPA